MVAVALCVGIVVALSISAQVHAILVPGRFVREPTTPSGFFDWITTLFARSGDSSGGGSGRFARSGSIDLASLWLDDEESGPTVDDNANTEPEEMGSRFQASKKPGHQNQISPYLLIRELAWPCVPPPEVDAKIKLNFLQPVANAEELAMEHAIGDFAPDDTTHVDDVVWVPTTIWELYVVANHGDLRAFNIPTQRLFVEYMNSRFPLVLRALYRDRSADLSVQLFIPIALHFVERIRRHLNFNFLRYDHHTREALQCEFNAEYEALRNCDGALAPCRSLIVFAIRAEIHARRTNKALLFGITKSVDKPSQYRNILPGINEHDDNENYNSIASVGVNVNSREDEQFMNEYQKNRREKRRPVIEYPLNGHYVAMSYSLFQKQNSENVLGGFFFQASVSLRTQKKFVYASFLDKASLSGAGSKFMHVPPVPLHQAVFSSRHQEAPFIRQLEENEKQAKTAKNSAAKCPALKWVDNEDFYRKIEATPNICVEPAKTNEFWSLTAAVRDNDNLKFNVLGNRGAQAKFARMVNEALSSDVMFMSQLTSTFHYQL